MPCLSMVLFSRYQYRDRYFCADIFFRLLRVGCGKKIRIPVSSLFPGWTETNATPSVAWLTAWKQWDYRKDSWTEVMHTVVNTADQYMLSLDDDQRHNLTTRYDDGTHTLTLVDTTTDMGWLSVRPVTEDALPEGYVLLSKATQTRTAYAVRYDENRVDMQKIRYMISFD